MKKYLLATAILSLAPVASAQQKLWEATANCKNAFGFYNQCRGYTGQLNLDAITESKPRISGKTTLLFDLSCSRATGASSKIMVEAGGTQAQLTFTNTPTLQTLEIPASPNGTVSVSFNPSPSAQYAPDCRIEWLGSLSTPDIFSIENLQTEQSLALEILESTLAGITDLRRLPAKWLNVREAESQVHVIRKSLEVNCLRNIIQLNRRLGKPVDTRLPEDQSAIDLLVGNDFASYEGKLERTVCSEARMDFEDKRIEGAIGVLTQQMNELDTLANSLVDALPLSGVCAGGQADAQCLTLGDELLSKTNANLELFRSKLAQLQNFISAEKARLAVRIPELKNAAARRNLTILQSTSRSWEVSMQGLDSLTGGH
ncbi:hypothetical protein [Oligoflexus tunisiensis]|uniref:hypothetical protein n=1 Tax=Oligoflexus tunisiensis TaxID=708132 RepID=UPI00114CB800|nr:hypothetical protein [Oligoflexus tunisiensis]